MNEAQIYDPNANLRLVAINIINGDQSYVFANGSPIMVVGGTRGTADEALGVAVEWMSTESQFPFDASSQLKLAETTDGLYRFELDIDLGDPLCFDLGDIDYMAYEDYEKPKLMPIDRTTDLYLGRGAEKNPQFIDRARDELASEYNKEHIKPFKLGLDFDGCITNDPELFKQIVSLCRHRGHKVYITTMRHESELDHLQPNGMTIREEWGRHVAGLVATGRKAKAKYALEKHNLKIDVWMDDYPRVINEDCRQVYGSVTPEGITIVESPGGVHMVCINGVPMVQSAQCQVLLQGYCTTPEHFYGIVDAFALGKNQDMISWVFNQFTPEALVLLLDQEDGAETMACLLRKAGFGEEVIETFPLSNEAKLFLRTGWWKMQRELLHYSV